MIKEGFSQLSDDVIFQNGAVERTVHQDLRAEVAGEICHQSGVKKVQLGYF